MKDLIDFCDRWLPYVDLRKTISLGCKNCGRMPMKHSDICPVCEGMGKEKVDGGWEDTRVCPACSGSGRASGKYEERL